MSYATRERESFVDRLIEEGRILATQRQLALGVLNYMDLHDVELLMHDGKRISALRATETLLSSKPLASANERLNAYAEVESRRQGLSFREAFIQAGSQYPDLVREHLGGYGSRRGGGNPIGRLNDLAEEKAAREGITFAEAYRLVQRENPQLARDCIDFYCS